MIVKVLCSDAAHDGNVVKVAGFMRPADDGWQERGATSLKQTAVDRQRREELSADLTELRRALKSKPTVDKPQAWQGVTADGKRTDNPIGAGHVKYRMRCERCGLDVQATEANLWPILDTLEQRGVTSISLAGLAAIMS